MEVIITLGFYSSHSVKFGSAPTKFATPIQYSVKELRKQQQGSLPPFVHKLHGEAKSNSPDRKSLEEKIEKIIAELSDYFQTIEEREEAILQPYWIIGVLIQEHDTVTCTLPINNLTMKKISLTGADIEICYYPCSN